MGPRNNLSNELDKERGMKKTLAKEFGTHAEDEGANVLDFLYVSPAKATKAEDLRRRSTRNRTIKDEDAEDKKKAVQAEAVLKKKEKAAAKRKAAASMKQKQPELKKPKQAELMNEEQAELKNQEQAELMNEELAELKNQEADNEKRKNITTPRANVKRCKVEDSVEDSEFAVMTDEVLAEENEILPESPMASQELIRSAIVKEYREKTSVVTAQCHKSKPSLSDQVAMKGSKRSMKRPMEDVYGAYAVEGYNKGKIETTEHYRALLRLAKEQRQSESEWNDASSKVNSIAARMELLDAIIKAEGKFDLVAELETLTAQHCEAEAELGAVKPESNSGQPDGQNVMVSEDNRQPDSNSGQPASKTPIDKQSEDSQPQKIPDKGQSEKNLADDIAKADAKGMRAKLNSKVVRDKAAGVKKNLDSAFGNADATNADLVSDSPGKEPPFGRGCRGLGKRNDLAADLERNEVELKKKQKQEETELKRKKKQEEAELKKKQKKEEAEFGNNASLMAIASTLDKLFRKFDLMDARFKKQLVDQKSIDDMVKVAVEERLKVIGI
ncbi:hypothetical protein IGI04_002108 [Brassica rapa subsp. trilocularis]|uniref:Uncharacterized protein n=1 Tax=Brassica rapa subsp. trilocularis TaxID=1813537 RepID=A0ABQ7NUK9_BRACM|nr:hypothetical protein IGI04_002108 [Brassica rapa subsp. trilocularis]